MALTCPGESRKRRSPVCITNLMNFGAQATRLCPSAWPLALLAPLFYAAKRSSGCTHCSGVDYSRIQINQTFLIPFGRSIVQGLGQTCRRLANYGIADKPSVVGRSATAGHGKLLQSKMPLSSSRLSSRGWLFFFPGKPDI